MASKQSYTITLKNNQTEKEGLALVIQNDLCTYLPSSKERKEILEVFGISTKYSRAFDLLRILDYRKGADFEITKDSNIEFIELKTTKKKIVDMPKGFFFGATENEFNLAEQLGEKYKFCFVSLHEESRSYKYLSLNELNSMIKTKRVQYQINLVK